MASLTEAEKFWKTGEKLRKKSAFHKPKWREAGDAFVKCSEIFQQYNNLLRSSEAMIEAGICYATDDMHAAAADKFEGAANKLCPKGKPSLNMELAADTYCRAGMEYVRAGNHKRCSSMLVACAKCLKDSDPDKAIEHLEKAIDIFMTEERAVYTIEIYELVLSIQLEKVNMSQVGTRHCGKCGVTEAMRTLRSMEDVYGTLKQPHNIRRSKLAQISLLCYQGNVDMAEEMALGVPDMREIEAEAGLGVVDAAKEEDEVLWNKALRHGGMVSMWPAVYKVLSDCHFDDSQNKKKRAQKTLATADGLTFALGDTGDTQPMTGSRFGDGVADPEEEEESGREDSYSL